MSLSADSISGPVFQQQPLDRLKLAQGPRTLLDHVDADVGIEQIAESGGAQKASRSACSWGARSTGTSSFTVGPQAQTSSSRRASAVRRGASSRSVLGMAFGPEHPNSIRGVGVLDRSHTACTSSVILCRPSQIGKFLYRRAPLLDHASNDLAYCRDSEF